jgi:hypothetical protein
MVFGDRLLVRRIISIGKSLLIFSQDEYIFKHYNIPKKGWAAPDGKKEFIPKDEAQGVTVSSFMFKDF